MAASFKRLGWGFDAVDLHRRLTAAGRPPSLDVAALADPSDPVTNAAAHWSIAHEHLLVDQDAGCDLRLVDLDDIVEQPVATYESLYRHAGLTWTDDVAAAVAERYAPKESGATATPTGGRAHDYRARDVSQVNRYWSDVLSEDEAARVEAMVGDLWERTRVRLHPT